MSSRRLKMTDGFDLKRILTGNYPEYSSPSSFVQGTFRTHGGKLYCSNTDVAVPEAWTSEHWTEIPRTVPDGTSDYSSSSAYAVGSFCRRNGALYVCKTAIGSGGEEWTAGHWTAMPDVSTLFSGANTSLMGVVRYDLGAPDANGKMADRTTNAVTITSSAVTLSFPDAVSGKARDFLVYVDASGWATGGSLTINLPQSAVQYGDAFPPITAAGKHLVAITEVAANTFYTRTIELKAPQS